MTANDLCRASFIALGVFSWPYSLAAETAAPPIQAPVVLGDENTPLILKRPEIYHPGWVDLNKDGQKDAYEDAALPVETRVDDLYAKMTRTERIGQLWQKMTAKNVVATDADALAKGEIGSYLGASPDAGLRNQLQRLAVEESRLGVPLIFGFDTIHGFKTIFPIPLAQSCTWDPSLVERMCAFAAAESAAAGVDWVFAPMVDVARDARWGRIAEGNGEDPWLGSLFAAAAVRGFQGPDIGREDRVAACLKHFAAYGAVESGSDYNSAEIGMPTLRNIYLPPFKAGVEAGAATLMNAFNSLNGVPATANRFLMHDVLRGEWGFPGLVVSDWSSVRFTINHGYTANKTEAADVCLKAGVDMEMVSDCYRVALPDLLEKGAMPEAVLADAVKRVLRLKLAKGLFDRPYTKPRRVDVSAAFELAREAAARSCVLLKNDNATLPLKPGSGKVALIGPLGANQEDLLGCWHGLGAIEDVVTLQTGLAQSLPGVRLTYTKGCGVLPTKDASEIEAGIAAAVAVAREADVIVLALGESEDWSGENHSRLDLGLPGAQQRLFDQVTALGKPVVTVLFAGRPLAIPTVLEKSSAVLMAWHPGSRGGLGVADVLTGAVEPSGRLTTSFPRSVGQVPTYYNHLSTGQGRADYKDGARAPLLNFGFGLTYTRFEYGETRLSSEKTNGEPIQVVATVTNTGKRIGTEVVQLYVRDITCSMGARPVRELKGYRRVTLQPGEKKDVSFTLTKQEMGFWSPEGKWTVEPGRFETVVAADSAGGKMVGFVLE